MKKKLLLLLTILSLNVAVAQEFVEAGIKYNVTSSTTPLTVEVIANDPIYSGAISIPETVKNSGITYTVTGIGDNAFVNCENLTSVSIPNAVTTIGYAAFARCKGLTSVSIPNAVTSIGNEAFNNSGLKSVIIPNAVSSIGEGAFFGCAALTDVIIPNSVTSIKADAFAECRSLASFSVNVSEPASITMGTNIFYESSVATATLIVPSGSETAYSIASQWDAFGTIVGGALSTNDVVLEKSFSVYPNPVQNTLFIKQNNTQELQKVSVYNTLGKQVLNSTNKSVDVSGLSSGLYLVKITTTAGSITKKMIKN